MQVIKSPAKGGNGGVSTRRTGGLPTQSEQPPVSQRVNRVVHIERPNFGQSNFKIIGTAPLVIQAMPAKLANAPVKTPGIRVKGGIKTDEELYEQARYISREGWDGFNAIGLKKGLVDVCRLTGAKMILAKMCIFVKGDGVDRNNPRLALLRIYGEPEMVKEKVRNAAGQAVDVVQVMYQDWYMLPRIMWDADQFSLNDITALLMRVGVQNGLGKGRTNGAESVGPGWGAFIIQGANDETI